MAPFLGQLDQLLDQHGVGQQAADERSPARSVQGQSDEEAGQLFHHGNNHNRADEVEEEDSSSLGPVTHFEQQQELLKRIFQQAGAEQSEITQFLAAQAAGNKLAQAFDKSPEAEVSPSKRAKRRPKFRLALTPC